MQKTSLNLELLILIFQLFRMLNAATIDLTVLAREKSSLERENLMLQAKMKGYLRSLSTPGLLVTPNELETAPVLSVNKKNIQRVSSARMASSDRRQEEMEEKKARRPRSCHAAVIEIAKQTF